MLRTSRILLCLLIAATGCFGCTDNSDNQPPTVVITGAPGDIFVVGEEMNIQIDAQDPEGGDVEFSFDWKPKETEWTIGDRAELLTFSSSALFTWDPLASDATSTDPIQIIFIVKDQAGKVTEKTITTKIVPGNGQPTFQSNVSEIYDPRTGKPLVFTVKVADQDSSEVLLTMDEATAPVGSSFTKTGPYEGTFEWEPTADQLDKRIRTVTFIADDMDNAEVPFDVTIVIRSKGAIRLDKDQTDEECPGEQIISHEPLGPQRGLVEPYVIEAQLENADRFDKVVTFWTFADAYNADFDPMDEDRQLNALEMEPSVNGFRAEIPNQASIITNDALTISYQICGFDNDATGDQAIVCAPSTGELELFYTFTAYLPEADDCVEDPVDRISGNDDTDTASGATDTWEYYRVCNGNSDFHSVTVRPGESGFIGITYNEDSDISFNVTDDQGGTPELKESTCTGLVTIDTSVAENGSQTRFYVEATGDNVEYQVRFFPIAGGPGGCVDDDMEPNDNAFDSHEVSSGDSFEAEICVAGEIDVYKIDLTAGDHITITNNFVNADGNLDMTLYSPDQAQDIPEDLNGVAFTFSLDDAETLEYDAVQTGTHYLMVFNNNETRNPYTISFDVMEAPPCPDTDQFTAANPNHTQDDAALLPNQNTVDVDLQVCPGQDDWLQRTEFNLREIVGAISVTGGDGAIGDMTWEILDLQGTVVHTASLNGADLEVDFIPQATGQYFHRIRTTARVEYNFFLFFQ